MSDIILTEEKVFDLVYKNVGKIANSNALMQSFSGVVGGPATLAVDALAIFTHYEPMINEIRALYGREPLSIKDFFPVASSMLKEIVVDLAVDKVIGSVPVAGIYFNAVSAKALTWRLGMIIAIVSARGSEINRSSFSDVVKLVRNLTPQSDMFKFTKPDYETFKKITLSVNGDSLDAFSDKVQTALQAFE